MAAARPIPLGEQKGLEALRGGSTGVPTEYGEEDLASWEVRIRNECAR